MIPERTSKIATSNSSPVSNALKPLINLNLILNGDPNPNLGA